MKEELRYEKLTYLLTYLLTVVAFLGLSVAAIAQDVEIPEFDWESYSYEQLEEIRVNFEEVFSKKMDEWALEHGDRVVELDANDITLYTTQYKTIVPTVTKRLDIAPDKTTLVWSSSDDTVARVAANGTVTAVGAGDAVITCVASDHEKVTASAEVHVILPVTALTIPNNQITLLLSQDSETSKGEVLVNVLPEDAFNKKVSWKSSDESVVTVDDEGNLQAVSTGRATVTAVSMDEFSSYPKTAAAYVTVNQAAEEIVLTTIGGSEVTEGRSTFLLFPGLSWQFYASVLPETATIKTLKWESSDPAVVSTYPGWVRGVGLGEATVTISTTDGSNLSRTISVRVESKEEYGK